jgi:tetratricopeptide (TPR) repeat protein
MLYAICSFVCYAQSNLYNYESSVSYGKYLFEQAKYEFAAEEFERAKFLNPSNDTITYLLLKSLRLADKTNEANRFFSEMNGNEPDFIIQEIVKSNILSETNHTISTINRIKDEKKRNFYLLAYYTSNSAKDSIQQLLLNKDFPNDTKSIMLKTLSLKTSLTSNRSPFVAASLSAIIPGTGKIYASDWKNGLLSLLYIGTSAWGSYRGFQKFGTKSMYGWVLGGVTAGFYLGNIWGSAKSAADYNKKLKRNAKKETMDIISDY